MDTIIYGNHSELYDITNSLATVACEIVLFLTCKKQYQNSYYPKVFQNSIDNDKSKKKFAICFAFVMGVISIFLTVSINDKVVYRLSEFFLKSPDANFFPNIFFTPIIIFILSIILRITPSVLLDLSAICTSACLIFYKTACTFCGCCYGIDYNGRFYNEYSQAYQFPIQMVELACAIVMFIILLTLNKSRKMGGKLFPLFMLMYCSSRFVTEFWRGDYPNIIGNLNGYHLQSIIGFCLGSIYMFIAVVFGKKINAYIQTKNEAFVERMKIEFPKWKKKHSKLWTFAKSQITGTVVSGFEIMIHMMLIDIVFRKYIDIGIYNPVLSFLGIKSVGYFWSFLISTAASYVIGFFYGRKFVFVSDANAKASMIKFAMLAIMNIFLCAWIGTAIQMFAKSIGFTGLMEDVIVKIITMNIPVIWSYPLNKYFVHRDLIKKN